MSLYLKRLMAKHRLMNQTGDGDGGGGTPPATSTPPAGGEGEGGAPAGTPPAGGDGDGAGAGAGEGEGGKPKPTDAEAKLLKEVMNKKNALRAAEDALKAYEGIDPVAARAALAAQQEQERQKLEAKGDYERLKEQMAAAHAAERSALETQLTESRAALAAAQATIAELTVGSAFSLSNFIKEEVALTPAKARIVYGSHFEFQDGELVAFDKPAGAQNRTPLVGSDGNPLKFEDALRKLVDADPDRDQILRSKMKQGTGSKTAPGTKPPKLPEVVGKGHSRISAFLKSNGGGIDLK